MTKCKECGTETTNLKFCSRSCSATYNNRGVRRHGSPKKNTNCLLCGQELEEHQFKFCSRQHSIDYRREVFVQRWLKGEVSGTVGGKYKTLSKKIKRYLLEEADHKCPQCGWGEVNAFSKTVPLEIDHIDGDPLNNSPSNLRVLCPNCHALTDNYCGLNKGKTENSRHSAKEYKNAGIV